jgi:hypothetical protein
VADILANNAVDGGGIYATHSNITMEDSRFVENLAQEYGGGICLQDNPMLDYTKTFIDLNHSDRGGCLFSLNRFASLSRCTDAPCF